MPLTNDISVVTQAIVTKLQVNAASIVDGIGTQLSQVFYGDQDRVPGTPAVCVEPGPMQQPLQGALYQVRIEMQIILMLYFDKLQNVDVQRKSCDQMATAIMSLLHQDKTLGGLVMFGHVTEITPGSARKNGGLMRASRIVWSGIGQLII